MASRDMVLTFTPNTSQENDYSFTTTAHINVVNYVLTIVFDSTTPPNNYLNYTSWNSQDIGYYLHTNRGFNHRNLVLLSFESPNPGCLNVRSEQYPPYDDVFYHYVYNIPLV